MHPTGVLHGPSMALAVAEGGLRSNHSKEKKMANRWVYRLAFVGLMMISVAATTGCRSASHGRRGAGCGGCNERAGLQAKTKPEMPMEGSQHQH